MEPIVKLSYYTSNITGIPCRGVSAQEDPSNYGIIPGDGEQHPREYVISILRSPIRL